MRTILIVDDEFGIVDVLVSAFEDEGYRVSTAANGRRGLERLAENKPDLVVLDLMMPLMDGAAMGREMRADSSYRDIPIIIMSVLREEAIRERFSDYQGFLHKPFRLPELLDLVATQLDEAARASS